MMASEVIDIEYREFENNILRITIWIEGAYFSKRDKDFIIRAKIRPRNEITPLYNSRILTACDTRTGEAIPDVWKWLARKATQWDDDIDAPPPADLTADTEIRTYDAPIERSPPFRSAYEPAKRNGNTRDTAIGWLVIVLIAGLLWLFFRFH
ncbi:hypothetical protein ABUE34_00775 [Kozakia baliensis]|uniref:hypothetical protein n=1 Tax=Kozakia baliensis TaxID=153496 RepID=UPI00345C041F